MAPRRLSRFSSRKTGDFLTQPMLVEFAVLALPFPRTILEAILLLSQG